MDTLITTKKNGETKVLLITSETPYKEIQDEISLAESYTFVYGRECSDLRKKVFDMQGKFNNLTEMLQNINREGKLNEDQRKIFYEFKEHYDNFIKLF